MRTGAPCCCALRMASRVEGCGIGGSGGCCSIPCSPPCMLTACIAGGGAIIGGSGGSYMDAQILLLERTGMGG